jgi:hypothetical protein
MALRALQKRVVRLERAAMARPSPFAIWFGSIDLFVDVYVVPEIADGKLDAMDMVDLVAALRRWEADGTWDRAHAY